MILKLNFPAEIEASEVMIEGRKFLLVDAAAFAALYAAREQTPAPAKRKARAGTPERRKSKKPAGVSAIADGFSPRAEKIAGLLKKQPMSSAEVIKATGNTASSIYTILSSMRKARQVETREDQDGNRVNVLIAKEAAPKMHGAAA